MNSTKLRRSIYFIFPLHALLANDRSASTICFGFSNVRGTRQKTASAVLWSKNTFSSSSNKPKPERKRRFLQDAHVDKLRTSTFEEEVTKTPSATKNYAAGEIVATKKTSKRVSSSAKQKAGKSIEDLERIMMSREMNLNREDAYSFEESKLDDSDDEEEVFTKNRGRMVMNPWDKEKRKPLRRKGRDKGSYPSTDQPKNIAGGDEFSRVFKRHVEMTKEKEYYKERVNERIQTKEKRKEDSNVFSRPVLDAKERSDKEWPDTNKLEDKSKRKTPTPVGKASKPRKPIPEPNALLDEDGKEMYLTLDRIPTTSVNDTSSSEIPSFSSMKLHPSLLHNLESNLEMSHPLDVQHSAFTPILDNKDVVISTATGSGKTIAFLLPKLQSILEHPDCKQHPKVIIMAPGRELASQIMDVTSSLIQNTPIKAAMAIGGTPFQRTVDKLRKAKPDIVIATPGRLAELIIGGSGEKNGKLRIPPSRPDAFNFTLILDEFDALLCHPLNAEPVKAVLNRCQKQHPSMQTILCSATATEFTTDSLLPPGNTFHLVRSTNNPKQKISPSTLHGVVHLPHKKRSLDMLRRLLHTEPIPQQVLVFVDNARKVDIYIDKLAAMNIIAAPLHGGQHSSKSDRRDVSRALREGTVGVVVSTEMAARGIDAPLLTHVVNIDLPTDASHYAHRAGRVGRGRGRGGIVVSFTDGKKEKNVVGRFGKQLEVDVHTVEVKGGRLLMVDNNKNPSE